LAQHCGFFLIDQAVIRVLDEFAVYYSPVAYYQYVAAVNRLHYLLLT